jgi:hypothetical protein
MLREATEQAAQIRIDLTEEYLALIDQVEAMPQNQPRADKSWVGRLLEWSAQHYARAVRVR